MSPLRARSVVILMRFGQNPSKHVDMRPFFVVHRKKEEDPEEDSRQRAVARCLKTKTLGHCFILHDITYDLIPFPSDLEGFPHGSEVRPRPVDLLNSTFYGTIQYTLQYFRISCCPSSKTRII